MKKLILLTFLSTISSFSFAKKVVLYIDQATLPMMQQVMHFVQHQDPENAYGFAFSRVNLNPELFTHLPDHHLSNMKEDEYKFFNNFLLELFEKYKESLELEIHSNLLWSLRNIIPLIKLTKENPNIVIKQLYLYDEGGAEYELLESYRDKDINQELINQGKILASFIQTGEQPKDSSQLIRYIFSNHYPTNYLFLKPNYINQEAFLAPLREIFSKNKAEINLFDFNQFNNLSPEKQKQYFSYLNINSSKIPTFSENNKNVIFIGTNPLGFDRSIDTASKFQINLIKHYLDKNNPLYVGDNAKFFFKGHPSGTEVNQNIAKAFPNISVIPPEVPFEILLMMNAKIDLVTGMNSSVFFNFPSEKIGAIFFTDKQGKTLEEIKQHPLARIFKQLCELQDQQIQKIETLPLLP